MSTNLAILPSRLPWNRFRYIKYKITDLLLGVDVRVTTRILSLPEIPPSREQRLWFIHGLHMDGWTNNEITNLLNSSGMTSPRGVSYTQSLVWVTLNKFKNRLDRLTDRTVEIGPPQFYLRKIRRIPWKRSSSMDG